MQDGARVRVTTGPPDIGELGACVDDLGDGTVPAFSGLPIEMDRHSPRDLRVQLRHGPITGLDEIVDLVETYEGRPPQLPGRGEQWPVVLGLDVGEVAVASLPIELSARFSGAVGDVSDVPVWASLEPVDVSIDYLRSGRPVDTYARAVMKKVGRRVARPVGIAERHNGLDAVIVHRPLQARQPHLATSVEDALADLAWVRPDEMHGYDVLPADLPLVRRLAIEGLPGLQFP